MLTNAVHASSRVQPIHPDTACGRFTDLHYSRFLQMCKHFLCVWPIKDAIYAKPKARNGFAGRQNYYL